MKDFWKNITMCQCQNTRPSTLSSDQDTLPDLPRFDLIELKNDMSPKVLEHSKNVFHQSPYKIGFSTGRLVIQQFLAWTVRQLIRCATPTLKKKRERKDILKSSINLEKGCTYIFEVYYSLFHLWSFSVSHIGLFIFSFL